MPFSFDSPEYIGSKKWDTGQRETWKSIMTEAVRTGSTWSQTMGELQGYGIGYRKQNLLQDLFRAKATEPSKTPEKYEAAGRWVKTIEEVKKQSGSSSREGATRFYRDWINKSTASIADEKTRAGLETEKWLYKPPGT